MIKIKKLGFIFKPDSKLNWWHSHAMAPSPILLNHNTIRVYLGCWDKSGISRIGYIDVEKNNPKIVKSVSDHCVLNIGEDGCFDENGVFPAHTFNFGNGTVYLYYTGFQLGHKIRHYNFGGLAISKDNGQTFERYSKAPILDRSDEGLFVRAGQSIEKSENGFHIVYSSGSSWHMCSGKPRPVYDIFYQHSLDGIKTNKSGKKIISCNLEIEHGLGRPQIVKIGDYFYCFYTRRIIEDMRYFLGVSRSRDCLTWERIDNVFNTIDFGKYSEFDSEMIYFPAVVKISDSKVLLFYSGNYFGRDGIGVIEIYL